MMDVSRHIYESFWRRGQLPLSCSISILDVDDGGKARVAALAYDIPAEMLAEYTVESLQKVLDTLPVEPKGMIWPTQ